MFLAEREQTALEHVEAVNELKRFRNSKYVQSDLGDSFCLVKDFLQKDRWVCFSGTPCQTEGLSVYLKYMTLCLCGAIMLRIIDSD